MRELALGRADLLLQALGLVVVAVAPGLGEREHELGREVGERRDAAA